MQEQIEFNFNEILQAYRSGKRLTGKVVWADNPNLIKDNFAVKQ